MKSISTLSKGLVFLFVAIFTMAAGKIAAQSLSIDPSTTQNIVAGGSIAFEADPSNYNGSGSNYSYEWSVATTNTSTPGTIAGGVTLSGSVTSTNQSGDQTRTLTFPTAGTYYVSCRVIRSSTNMTTSIVRVNVAPPPAPTVTISPAPSATVVLGGSVGFSANTSNFTGSGTITYTWSVSPGTAGVDYVIPAGNSSSKTISFNSNGNYNVTVTASRAAQSANPAATAVFVFIPNLYSTSGSGTIKAYDVNPVTGAVTTGPVDVASPTASTAGLGKNKVSVNDGNGNLYYILNTSSNSGIVEIYSLNPSGGSSTSVGSIDMNGGSNGANLGFVRLAFDANGLGWILAGDGASNVYIASFQGNGNSAISLVNTYSNTPLSFSGSGSAADFQNGDIAIGPGNILYALANITGGNTYIYTLNPGVPSTLTRKWTVQTGGGVFSGTSVNGVAWTQTGSLHISTGNGIYFIDQTTANSAALTVQATQVLSLSGLTDLASNQFPSQSTLPVSFGEIAVKQVGAIADVSWTTLSEFNNNHFVVERSNDAVNFKAVGTVAGKGNSSFTQYYSFSDAIGSANSVIYYRIQQVDADGTSSYSKTVALRLGSSARISNYTAYPNPFTNNIKLQIDANGREDVMIRINSLAGQTLVSKRITLQAGNNIVVFDNLQQLQSGIYLLEVVGNDGKHVQRLIKN